MSRNFAHRTLTFHLSLFVMFLFALNATSSFAQQAAAPMPTDISLRPPPGDDDYPIDPYSGPATLTVGPSAGNQFADLQAAIDAARPGDTILLEAGKTFTAVEASFTLRDKGSSTEWITIRSA